MTPLQRITNFLSARRPVLYLRARRCANSLRRLVGRSVVSPSLGEQWAAIHRSGPIRQPAASGAPVVFAPLWAGTSSVNKALESVLAHALAVRGVPVEILSCGRGLLACVPDPWGNRRPAGSCDTGPRSCTPEVCPSCVYATDHLYQSSPLRRRSIADYALPGDVEEAVRLVDGLPKDGWHQAYFHGVGIGEHALASALRATGRGTLLPDSKAHQAVLRRQLIGCATLVLAARRYIADVKPRRIVLMHGIYADHGTLADVAKAAGVPITVFAKPYRKDTILLCHGETYHRALVDEPVGLWENSAPDPAARARLLRYVESRRTGSQDSLTYHPNPTVGQDAIYQGLGLRRDLPVISVFTNVMWDASLFHEGSAFPNMLDWLFATIDFYAATPEVQLVIRVHPAEVKSVKKSLQPVTAEIAARYPSLPANIHVIGPESDLSSYDLAELSAASIVYGTKMALEIALRSVPTLVSGESFIRGKGFTLDASSPEQYRALLADLHLRPRLSEAQLERARRYAEHFFFRRQIDFPFVRELAGSEPRLDFTSLDELAAGVSPELDAICDGLLDGREILSPARR